ncbi:MAG: hypothetical protein ABI261_03715 [Ginsengibacter sp.]
MFPTLFNVKINWIVYILVLVGIQLIIPNISFWPFLALAIALHQFMLLFYAYGYVIPVRYWAGAMLCLQMLVGPSFAYSGLDKYMFIKYQMQVPVETYFAYAIPAVILFILGLHSSGKLNGERIEEKAVREYVKMNPQIPYIFIAIGFLSSMVSTFFGASLANVFYLLDGFKFIGLFMLLLSGSQLKLLPMVLVIGSIVVSSLKAAMFHDLLTWVIFLLAILAVKYKPKMSTKILFATGMLVLVIIIQQLKSVYREASASDRGVDQFEETFRTVNQDGGVFDASKLAESNVRINQGFIVTYAMEHVPSKEPFADGSELYKILEAAFMPRILAPNKLKAGDNSLVYKYTGIVLRQGTSMSISALGDFYVNFGTFGGCICMFIFGWLFNFVLNNFKKFSRHFPIILIFTPLVFYYPIRPDTALQTGLGHLVKSCFLLYVMILFWKKDLYRGAVSKKIAQKKTSMKNLVAEG